ncbi:MAG TPA: 16S rRNA (adenine(1518)-N(6)/adenine(1519)-N(6))-dimethyltransferase RsmA [Candidatus Saccharimonadia bacterium]|nr:16S rRNA (adenine(1518)-N(6)/adenine(1519)-N(6))-dimethyltransferase RsmA [Candidatus Saccharimonadia bacterium]
MKDSAAAKKSLGQHWLDDPASLQAMCDAGDVNGADTVLEVGPGLGSLTQLLTQYAKQVVAVEFDRDLATGLSKCVPADNLKIMSQDILSFDFSTLPADYKLVANIPYYLTSNLIRTISEVPNRPVKAVMLVQKEVAERAAAKPGDMSLLSVTAQFYWEVSLGQIVPAELFTPEPKVDSQILKMERRDQTLFPDVDPKDFFRLARAGFSQRRKTLLNSLSGGLSFSRDETRALCDRASVDCERRAQTLSLDEWRQLYSALHA